MENAIAVKIDRVCQILEQHQRDPHKLIPILQEIQEEYQYLPEEIMTFVSTALGLSTSQVYGVATFYSHFTLSPKGKYVVKVCDGTACHVKKSTSLIDAIAEELGLSSSGKTTEDLLFTLETVACLGACGLAPAIVINEQVYGHMTPESTVQLIKEIKAKEAQI